MWTTDLSTSSLPCSFDEGSVLPWDDVHISCGKQYRIVYNSTSRVSNPDTLHAHDWRCHVANHGSELAFSHGRLADEKAPEAT
jgi:hypothetical protein